MKVEKTNLMWIDESQQIILGCSDKLWSVLQKYKKSGIQNLDIITLAKVYKEIKSLDENLLEKENKNV